MSGSVSRRIAWAGVVIVIVALCLADLAVTHGVLASDGLAGNLPVMAVLLLVALLVLPPLIRSALSPSAEGDPALAALHGSIRSGQSRLYARLGLAALATLAGLIALAGTLTLPSAEGAAKTLDLTRSTPPASGRVVVVGARPAGAELRYQRDRLGLSPATRFLPVDDGGHRGAPWLVVELPDDGLTFDPNALPTGGFTGLMVADGLPASAQASLRQSSALVPGHYWTLYTTPEELYRPYWLRAAARLLVALLLLALAGLDWWQLRELEAAEGKLRAKMIEAS